MAQQRVNRNQSNVASVSVGINTGYGTSAQLVRTGNIVIWSANAVFSGTVPALDSAALAETIPAGYRPTAGTYGEVVGNVVVGAVGSRMAWYVTSNGQMQLSNTNATSGATRMGSTGMWVTNDAWPV